MLLAGVSNFFAIHFALKYEKILLDFAYNVFLMDFGTYLNTVRDKQSHGIRWRINVISHVWLDDLFVSTSMLLFFLYALHSVVYYDEINHNSNSNTYSNTGALCRFRYERFY